MEYTYDTRENGVLTIKANATERDAIREAIAENDGECSSAMEAEALEPLICNSELEWIRPEEIGALTDAPILGIRGDSKSDSELGEPTAAWGFMDYCLRSFLEDLVETGEAVFTS